MLLTLLAPLTIALSSSVVLPIVTVQTETKEAQSVPLGAQRVDALDFTVTVPCSAGNSISFSSVTVKHIGLGDMHDIAGVALFKGSRRLTRFQTFNQTQPLLTLLPKNLSLPACSTTTFSLLMNYSANAAVASQHGLQILQDGITLSNAQISLLSAQKNHSAQTVTGAVPTLTVTPLPLLHAPTYGSNRLLARFQLKGDSSKDAVLTSISLRNKGKARMSDVQDLWLQWNDGTKITPTLISLNDDIAVFTFNDGTILSRNAARILELHGTVAASRKQTIQFELEEQSDFVVEAQSR